VNVERAGTSGQKVNVIVHRPGRLPTYDRFVFDVSGRLIDSPKTTGEPVSRQVLFALQPLHFGWFGGLAVKIAYGLLGLSLCVVTSSGVTIWLARRRDKGRPAPTWERLWTGTIWGQPIALIGAALCALAWSGATAAGLGWAVSASSVYVFATLHRDNLTLDGYLRRGTAVLLTVLAIAHGVRWGERMSDKAGWMIDLALICDAIAIVAPLRRRRGA
jgi:hypothetical protein